MPAAAAGGHPLVRLGAHRLRLLELLLRVVDRGQAVIGLDVVGLELDRLLEGFLRLVPLLLARVDGAEVVIAVEALRDLDDDRVELRDRLVVLPVVGERRPFGEVVLILRAAAAFLASSALAAAAPAPAFKTKFTSF